MASRSGWLSYTFPQRCSDYGLGQHHQRLGHGSITRPSSNFFIDHIISATSSPISLDDSFITLPDDNPATTAVSKFGTYHFPEWSLISDHSPLWANINIVGSRGNHGTQPTESFPPLPPFRPINIPLGNIKMCDEFSKKIANYSAPLLAPTNLHDAVTLTEKITQESVRIAKSLQRSIPTARPHLFNGWSPLFLAHKAHLHFLVTVCRHLTGRHHAYRWKEHEIDRGIRTLVSSWEKAVFALANHEMTSFDPHEVLAATGMGPSSWRTLSRSQTIYLPSICTAQQTKLKKLMHYKNRSLERTRFNALVAAREESCRKGKLKTVIQSLTNKPRETYTMQRLLLHDGTTTTSPARIHSEHTNYFEDKFKIPSDFQHDPFQSLQNPSVFLFEEQTFYAAHAHLNIPQSTLCELWQGIAYPINYTSTGERHVPGQNTSLRDDLTASFNEHMSLTSVPTYTTSLRTPQVAPLNSHTT